MITTVQREARARRIGSSDAAAILHEDPYRSPADVWLEKTGRARGFDGNENTERGNLLEPAVRSWCLAELGTPIDRCTPDYMRVHESNLLIANLDAAILRSAGSDEIEQIIEVKTTVVPDEWGDEGTDQVPTRVLVQVHHQFACVPTARLAWVPVLMPGFRSFDFRLYKVERDASLVASVEKAGLDFMRKYVLPEIAPDDYRPSLDVLKRVRREPEKCVTVPKVAVSLYLMAQKKAKDADEELERAKADVIACLGDAEAGECDSGRVTYLEQTARRLDAKKVQQEHPEIAVACTAESTYRVLRFKAKKQQPAELATAN